MQHLSKNTEESGPVPGEGRQRLLSSSIFNVSKVTLSMAITMPLGMVTRIVIPRVVGSEKAGILFFAESFPMLILCFMTLGMPAYVHKHVPPRHEHAKDIFDSICVIEVLMGLLLIGGLMVYMHFSAYDALTARVTMIMACYCALTLFTSQILQPFFLALGNVSFTAVINVVAKVVMVALVLACLWLKTSIEWLAIAFLASQVIVLVLMLRKARSSGLTGGGVRVAQGKTVVLASLPFLLSGVLSNSSASIDSAVLSQLATFKELGYYGAVVRLQGVFLLLVPIVIQVFMPVLSRTFLHDRPGYAAIGSNVVRALLVFAFPLAIAFTAFGQEIMLAVYGADFQPATLTSVISGPLLLSSYLVIFSSINATITTNGKMLAVVMGVGAVCNFGLDYVLIKAGGRTFGEGGAAAGAVLASLLVQSTLSLALLRIAGAGIFNRRTVYVIAMTVLPGILLALGHGSWMQLPFATRLALVAVGIPAYLFAARLVTVQDVTAIVAAVRSRRLAA